MNRTRNAATLSAGINGFLESFERAPGAGKSPRRPVVFIIGSPRSGSTLVYQYLAKTGLFAYPSNLMARFYGSGHFAALVQSLLGMAVHDPLGELSDFRDAINLKSEYGKTRGFQQPSEFWFFWRRFFPLDVPKPLCQSDGAPRPAEFAAELADIETVLDKPLLMKALLLCFDLDVLVQVIPDPIFVFLERDIAFNAQSILVARERLMGDREKWYSTKPPEYEWLRKTSSSAQVVGQVFFTNRAIVRQLKALKSCNVVHVKYEHFCQNPGQLLEGLAQYFGPEDFDLDASTEQETALQARNQITVEPEVFEQIQIMVQEIVHDPAGFKERQFGGGLN